jgi:hypothetical protein
MEADQSGATQEQPAATQTHKVSPSRLLGFKTPWPSVDNKRPRGPIQRETMTPNYHQHTTL